LVVDDLRFAGSAERILVVLGARVVSRWKEREEKRRAGGKEVCGADV